MYIIYTERTAIYVLQRERKLSMLFISRATAAVNSIGLLLLLLLQKLSVHAEDLSAHREITCVHVYNINTYPWVRVCAQTKRRLYIGSCVHV